jgi:hypothetical protein
LIPTATAKSRNSTQLSFGLILLTKTTKLTKAPEEKKTFSSCLIRLFAARRSKTFGNRIPPQIQNRVKAKFSYKSSFVSRSAFLFVCCDFGRSHIAPRIVCSRFRLTLKEKKLGIENREVHRSIDLFRQASK